MHLAVAEEGVMPFREHLTLDEIRRKRVTHLDPLPMVDLGVDVLPIDRRIAEKNAEPPPVRPRCVYIPDALKHLTPRLVVAQSWRHRVAPYLTERLDRDVLATHESIGDVLIPGTPVFDDDVADRVAEPRIVERRQGDG